MAEICRRLEGLPLSIELAAARTRFLAPSALLARLGRRLDLLVAGPRDAPARHRTLRATIEWSYQLLSPAEQRLFAQLGVFVGGCELEAAEAVCGDSVDVLATLEGLAGHSLVRREAGSTTRIAMLETLREFAVELLESSGEAESVRGRHAAWYLDLGGARRSRIDRSTAGRLAPPSGGRSRQPGRRADVARTGRGRTSAPALRLRALALLAHQRLRRGGETVAHLRALSAGHVTADRPCQRVTTCGELRPTATRRGGGRETRSRSARGRTNDAGRAHAGGRPRDGRQRELLDRAPRARSHDLRGAAGRRDLGSASSVVARTR